jgi:hypothetical protein
MLFGYLGGHFSLELRISSHLRRFARNSFISSLLSKGKSRWQSQKLSLLSVSTTYKKLPSPRTESGCLWRWLEHLKTTLPKLLPTRDRTQDINVNHACSAAVAFFGYSLSPAEQKKQHVCVRELPKSCRGTANRDVLVVLDSFHTRNQSFQIPGVKVEEIDI